MSRFAVTALLSCGVLFAPGLVAAQTFNPLWAVPNAEIHNASAVTPAPKQTGSGSFFASLGGHSFLNAATPGAHSTAP
jgi:hypothetical protein